MPIETPASPELATLREQLAAQSPPPDELSAWPAASLAACAEAGVYRWFLPEEAGGLGWSEEEILRGYLALSSACLTTTFILTQFTGACQRIAASENRELRGELLPQLLAGEHFTTLGISHLTTSRRHLGKPALLARETPTGFLLQGYSPWCTGAPHADSVVAAAEMEDGRQLTLLVPTNLEGVATPPGHRLVALTAAATGPLQCDQVEVPRRYLLAGPEPELMQRGGGGRTGGLQTSTLALGLAAAALRFLEEEREKRNELAESSEELRRQWEELRDDLLAAAAGKPRCTAEALRTRSNSLVLRMTQAALTAAKGAGFVEGHPAGRWCREALFFLVWSCPQPVLQANLCELAGLG